MKVSFNGGFIKLPNTPSYINVDSIGKIQSRVNGDTEIVYNGDIEPNTTSISASKILEACLKAQKENILVKINKSGELN